MVHPHKRTWTLGDLDRESVHRLWFDPVAFRWECVPLVWEAGAVLASESGEVDSAAQRADTAPCLHLGSRIPASQGNDSPSLCRWDVPG